MSQKLHGKVMDNLSNFLSSLKNIVARDRTELVTGYSKLCENVANVLKEKNFLEKVEVMDHPEIANAKQLKVTISRVDGKIKFNSAKRISKPGVRIYESYKNIKPVLGGRGVVILSTTKGVMSGEDAKKERLGGEVLCEVY